ncbi:MAG TPA: HK97 gp10 family phage protein, partial [Arthrobacter sp.]|nr:HK97 gp10 family phage protein [Arthrobacter sp.]
IKSALAGLDMLNSPKLRESLARSMCVAGGKLLRDDAKMLVPVDTGRLKASLYLAYSPEASTGTKIEYHVSWRKGKGQMGGGAPHGHLIEFGHWQTHKAYKGSDGQWYSSPEKLANPKWIAARPFLRPALEGGRERAYNAMIVRGKQRLPELLNGVGGDDRE